MAEHRGLEPDGSLRVSRSLRIPASEISVSTSTPGGPGGQHANRTESKVTVSFDVEASEALGPRQRARILAALGPQLRVTASESRSQATNKAKAFDRLAGKLAMAIVPPTVRRKTRPPVSASRKRLKAKREQAERKQQRRRPGSDD
jgi:ribosome-associated protein